MNYKLSIACLSILMSVSGLFCGKITIYNETPSTIQATFTPYEMVPVAGTARLAKAYKDIHTITVNPNSTQTYEASAPSGYLVPVLKTPIINYYGLDGFNFTSPSKFIVKGAAGETFSDYSKIDVPESGSWQLWIKSA